MSTYLPSGAPPTAREASALIYATERPDAGVMRLMMCLEASGRSAYEDLADGAPCAEVAVLFRANAREELAHAHRLRKALKLVTGVDFPVPADADNPYVESRRGTAITPDVLLAMAASERNGEALYFRWADNAGHDEVARLFRLNGAEEAGHSARLERAAGVLEAGVVETERSPPR